VTILSLENGTAQRHGHSLAAEQALRLVLAVTLVTMVAEVAAGLWSGSLALVADAWHMAAHAIALGIAAFAYWFARTRAADRAFAFGTGKVYALSGYTSALALFAIALGTIAEAGRRLWAPEAVRAADALPVALVGLLVNAISALLLHRADRHGHQPGHAHGCREHEHRDPTLHGALLHVLADLLVSCGVLLALGGVHFFGWVRLDPLLAVVSSLVVVRWAYTLGRKTGRELLDITPDLTLTEEIRARLEALEARVMALHLWDIGGGRRACVVALESNADHPLERYKAAVLEVVRVAHLAVEVSRSRS
jgi:cation diffusion facilitator family transporter